MTIGKAQGFIALLAILSGCTTSPPTVETDATTDMAVTWVRDAAEYRAVAQQIYRSAAIALPAKLADRSWSALPGQQDAAGLPPAIILDVDETALTNPLFQQSFVAPFTDKKLDDWSIQHAATPVPGITDFIALAGQSGVEIFFVTNRPCVAAIDAVDSCPQKTVVVNDLLEAGLPADHDNVSLSGERQDWGKEKITRRKHIAERYRVIMIFGDDLSDFIPCVRKRNIAPCDSNPATAESRLLLLHEYDEYWGNGWYILPNPMHGSWTSFR